MNMRRLALLAICLIAMPFVADAQRSEQLLERGWRFTRQDCADFKELGYDDSAWQEVVVPHDWAIYGPFSIHNDQQNVAITQDGQHEGTYRHSESLQEELWAVNIREMTYKSVVKFPSPVLV